MDIINIKLCHQFNIDDIKEGYIHIYNDNPALEQSQKRSILKSLIDLAHSDIEHTNCQVEYDEFDKASKKLKLTM